jgi:hypothetical protein
MKVIFLGTNGWYDTETGYCENAVNLARTPIC